MNSVIEIIMLLGILFIVLVIGYPLAKVFFKDTYQMFKNIVDDIFNKRDVKPLSETTMKILFVVFIIVVILLAYKINAYILDLR